MLCRFVRPFCILAAVTLWAAVPAQAQTPPVLCTAGPIQPGGGGADLEVKGPCTVGAGTYQFRYVNVHSGGSLTFADAKIDFWAQSILVENQGRLIAGTPQAPIGTAGGVLTIYLYGPQPTAGSVPIACKSSPTCGVDPSHWTTDPAAPIPLPGGVTDYFYQYHSLPGPASGPDEGYFGFKVLAVSYGGTLNLYGKKGASYGTLDVSSSGTSWARLDRNMRPDDKTAHEVVVDRPVDWEVGDEIVVTTTDYLPGHSEQFEIASVVGPKRLRLGVTLGVTAAAKWAHRGTVEDLKVVPARVGLELKTADLRAAVGLLTRSIRIVSAGAFGDTAFPETPGNYHGGHTIVRQGFAEYRVQGVEFKWLGQGGRLGHYPVHFHMARKTPAGTFVTDSAMNESMTRWITVHGTHGVTFARNVGYKSIGHGFYIEDGTETDNRFLANLGVFARAAVDNVQNPRKVPGILAAPDGKGQEMVPYHSDYDHPSVFWIMNGWNDFQYNFAAGAGTCGVCYWLVPGYNGGHSAGQNWSGYAAMQKGLARAGMTPLKSFVGNTCTSAMNSFNTIGDSTVCNGVGGPTTDKKPKLEPIDNPLAPPSSGEKAQPLYYPNVDRGGGRFATLCDETKEDCTEVKKCGSGEANEKNCAITAIDRYTSSFHWAETNFSALWLRPQWYLFINSVLTDVQNGGLTFVTGGGYTESDVINGYWALARKSVFIGQSQRNNPFAADTSPFNPEGLQCDTDAPNYCVSRDEGVSFPISNFGMNQRFFNIYDGPSYQDSNAYLDIQRATIDDCHRSPTPQLCLHSKYLSGRVVGLPVLPSGTCYMPNAAIAWKQPNGFYYPPAFHSRNLFFHDVDIRHFVIEPLFQPDTFVTDPAEAKKAYCNWNDTMFAGFTDIDRQTELNDDDGSLTGFVNTISVNEDPFFDAPVQTVECDSDRTAVTSPYDYVTSVVYPACAVNRSCDKDDEWSQFCSTELCYGVPLYRQQLTGSEMKAGVSRAIRMMGQAVSQRSSLTANNGVYYIDTTVGLKRQRAVVGPPPGGHVNVFRAGQTYYVFLLFAKPTTKQTYELYVGRDPDFSPDTAVSMVRADVRAAPFTFTRAAWPAAWQRLYDPKTGLLTVSLDMSIADFGAAYAASGKGTCRPFSFCGWNEGANKCQCALKPSDPLFGECTQKNAAGDDAICSWAVQDFHCPSGGCFGFEVTLSKEFATDPSPDPRPDAACFPNDARWNVSFQRAPADIAGACAKAPIGKKDFCATGRPRPKK